MKPIRSATAAAVVLLLGGLVPTSLWSATWRPVPLFGGEILSIAPVPSRPGQVFAGTASAGIVKSTDFGRTWRSPGPQAAALTAYRLEVSPFDPQLLFAEFGSFSSSFARSRDGGVTWSELEIGPRFTLGAHFLTLDPRTPRALWAATDHGIYRSADAGDHWTFFALGDFAAEAVGVHPTNPSVLLAIGRDRLEVGRVFRSLDGGATWRESIDFPGIVESPRFAFRAGYERRVFLYTSSSLLRSDDLGATWVAVDRGLSTYVRDFALTPEGNLLIATPYGVLRSADFGETWLPEPGEDGFRLGGPDGSVAVVAPLPGSGGAILSGSQRGIWRSGSGGAGWRASSQGITAHRIRDVAATSGPVPHVTALTFEIFASADSGESWKRTSRGAIGDAPFPPSYLSFDPIDGERVYADGPGGLFVSRDGGSTWRFLLAGYSGYPPFLRDVNSAFAIDPRNPKKLYRSFGSSSRFDPDRTVRFSLSTDGGRTWRDRQRPLEATALAVDPFLGNTLYATTAADLKKSLDAGTTWRSVGGIRHPTALALDPKRPGALWVATPDGAVSQSLDGGQTFTPLGSPFDSDVVRLVADPERPDGVFAGVSGRGIFRWDATTAGWVPQGDGLSDRFRGIFALDARRDVLWAATEGAGLERLELD